MAEAPQAEAAACGICLEQPGPQNTALSGCTHSFCWPCIAAWAERETRCPLCRARFITLTELGGEPVPVAHRNQVYEFDGLGFVEDDEDALESIVCAVCLEGDREGELLLCSRFELCSQAAHASCLGLSGVPEQDWECARCSRAAERRASRALRRAHSLASPAALGRRRSSAEDGDAELDDEGPPPTDSPAGAAPAWVARQRQLAASAAERADGDGAVTPRAGLNTVSSIRRNWESLRRGVLSFHTVLAPGVAGGASTAQRGRGSRSAPRSAPEAAPEEDDAGRAWADLDALRAEEAAPRRVIATRPGAAARRSAGTAASRPGAAARSPGAASNHQGREARPAAPPAPTRPAAIRIPLKRERDAS